MTAFADDVRAYLEGRALPGGSRRYRVMKFLRRHRVGVAMTALSVVLAGAGIGGIVYQASETSRQAQAVSAVKEFLLSLFAASSPNEAKGHDLSVRELLDRGRTQIERNLSAQPEVRSELQGALGRIYFQLGIYDEAEALQRNALAAAGSNGNGRAVLARQLAETLAARGNLAEAEPMAMNAGAALQDSGDPQERVRAWITRSTIAQKRGTAAAATCHAGPFMTRR